MMTEAEAIYHEIAKNITRAEKSQMFGKPCYKINSKAFICFFQDEMVFKLAGDVHKEALALNGSKLFDPSGKQRAMKEWVQVPFEHSQSWQQYAGTAANYVESLSK